MGREGQEEAGASSRDVLKSRQVLQPRQNAAQGAVCQGLQVHTGKEADMA